MGRAPWLAGHLDRVLLGLDRNPGLIVEAGYITARHSLHRSKSQFLRSEPSVRCTIRYTVVEVLTIKKYYTQDNADREIMFRTLWFYRVIKINTHTRLRALRNPLYKATKH